MKLDHTGQLQCTTCHDPHGIRSAHSTPTSGKNLINFDRRIALPLNNNGPSYTDLGTRRGSCLLKCHNKDHNNLQYSP